MLLSAELIAFASFVALATWASIRAPASRLSRVGVALGLALSAAVGAGLAWRPHEPSPAERSVPQRTRELGYVSSAECRACHPQNYASWYRSYHRTMTQVASRETILAPFEPALLTARGRTLTVDVRDGQLWVDSVDGEAMYRFLSRHPRRKLPEDLPRLSGPVVMTTGSHHMQIYWVRNQLGAFQQLSWLWLKADQRWLPAEEVYNQPGNGLLGVTANWSTGCSECHATGPEPKVLNERQTAFDTEVGELGIACEACHGPGARHVQANQNPLRRYWHQLTRSDDPSIVNPAKLAHTRSAQVCGSCHGVLVPRHPTLDLQRGSLYRPGDELDDFKLQVRLAGNPGAMPYFWPDGTSRSVGREYNGMVESRCYSHGELDCTSCHSMHQSDPDDQLAAGNEGDAACLGCHGGYASPERIEAHTHHPASSPGSTCYNCHMPNTNYGLLKLTRNHRIDVPVVRNVEGGQRPDACGLCHLDQTLAWTQGHLAEWYGRPRTALTSAEETTPAGLLWLARGNSLQRATAAWHMGWEPAKAAMRSRTTAGWQSAWLARSLDDPYASVRYVAARSLRGMRGYEGFDYDYTAFPAQQQDAVARALELAGAAATQDDGRLFEALRIARDETPILFPE